MSSTEAISMGSLHDYSSDNSVTRTPSRKKMKSPPSSPGNSTPDEVQIEIDELMFNVPELENYFTITNKIGSGTFSSVYIAKLQKYNVEEMFALKHILPTSHPSRIESELRCLKDIGGCDNVIGVKACLRHKDHVVIIMPYFAHDRFQDYIRDMTVSEARMYMYNLFVALHRVHEVDVIHRDVKPSNFLYNRKLKKYALVDFGLAQKAPVALKSNPMQLKKESVTPGGSTRRSTEQENAHQLSAEKVKKSSCENQQATRSPMKRKLDCDSAPQSPSKRRPLADSSNKLLRKCSNDIQLKSLSPQARDDKKLTSNACVVLQKTDIKNIEQKVQTPNVLTPEANLFDINNPKSKSPRRLLLTKRTLQMDHPAMRQAGSETLARRTTVVVGSGSKAMYRSVAPSACQCFGQPSICSICMARSNQMAPRAGTPGFRSPEVLMKCPDQSTAVDIWSAGIIFLSILSGRYPFFKANDDMTALAQIMSIFGSENMKRAAKSYGKELSCSPNVPAVDLKIMCQKLRGSGRKCATASKSKASKQDEWNNISDCAYDLLSGLLALDPMKRLTADKALKHPFFEGCHV